MKDKQGQGPIQSTYLPSLLEDRTGDLTHVNEQQALCDYPSLSTVRHSSMEEWGRSR